MHSPRSNQQLRDNEHRLPTGRFAARQHCLERLTLLVYEAFEKLHFTLRAKDIDLLVWQFFPGMVIARAATDRSPRRWPVRMEPAMPKGEEVRERHSHNSLREGVGRMLLEFFTPIGKQL